MASRAPTIRILPLRDGDPPAPSHQVPTEGSSREELLAFAETLGVPWRRLILQEIEAEQKLRRYLPDVQAECPLESALTILSVAAERSWRVRDQVETLACQARRRREAREKGSGVSSGTSPATSGPDPSALARHCGFAYQRILLLQRVRRAAARSRGSTAERLAFVCSTARCSFEDAAWALGEEKSPRRGRRMEAAIRKVREEGFLVPRAATEARSLSQLRRIVFAASKSEFRDASPRYPSRRAVLMQIVRESKRRIPRRLTRARLRLAVALLLVPPGPAFGWPRRRNEKKDLDAMSRRSPRWPLSPSPIGRPARRRRTRRSATPSSDSIRSAAPPAEATASTTPAGSRASRTWAATSRRTRRSGARERRSTSARSAGPTAPWAGP